MGNYFIHSDGFYFETTEPVDETQPPYNAYTVVPKRPNQWSTWQQIETIWQWVEDTAQKAIDELAMERTTMVPFIAAFDLAQALVSAPDGLSLHLLDQVTTTIAGAREFTPYAPLVIWADRVTQIIRSHPDMATYAATFGLSELQVDALCRIAMEIDGENKSTTITALVNAYEAL
ncbi:MAG: hypothetical protein AAGD43_21415 [Pseudomonadota bacterium]